MSNSNGKGPTAIVVLEGIRYEKQIFERQVGFDSETGKPVIETQIQKGFNAMTGEPEYVSIELAGFDNLTQRQFYVEKYPDIPKVSAPVESMRQSVEHSMQSVEYNKQPVDRFRQSVERMQQSAEQNRQPAEYNKQPANRLQQSAERDEQPTVQMGMDANPQNESHTHLVTDPHIYDKHDEAIESKQASPLQNGDYEATEIIQRPLDEQETGARDERFVSRDNNRTIMPQMVNREVQPQTNNYEEAEPNYQESMEDGRTVFLTENELFTEDNRQNKKKNKSRDKKTAKTGNKGKKVLIAVAIVVAAVALLGGFVYAGIETGFLLPPRYKVAYAAYKTFKSDNLASTLVEASSITGSDELTCEMSGKVNVAVASVEIDMDAACKKSEGTVYADGSVGIGGISQDVQFYFDNSKVQIAAPGVVDKVLEYDYTADNDGYIAEYIKSNTSGDIRDINDIFSAISLLIKGNSNYSEKVNKGLRKVYNNIQFKKTDSQIFEVDGKDRKCAGYIMTITGENMKELSLVYSEASDAAYGDARNQLAEALSALTGTEISLDDTVNYDDFEDIEVTFYLYGGKLAAVKSGGDDGTITVKFEGGDTRTANMEIVIDNGDSVVTYARESTVKDGKEEGSILRDDKVLCTYEYDKEDGEFEISPTDTSKVKGTFVVDSKSQLTFSFDGNIEELNLGIKVDMIIKKGADIKEIDGNTLDVGTATMDDFVNLVKGIVSKINMFG